MSRTIRAGLMAAFAATLSSPAAANDAYTTRIEPQPYYGATVTIEAGVRVFRPLPPTRQVIISPGLRTPLSLGFNDTRVIEESTSRNYYYDYSGNGGNGGGYGSFAGSHGSRRHNGHHGHAPMGGHGAPTGGHGN